jgi:opacity protein-like surface antigen
VDIRKSIRLVAASVALIVASACAPAYYQPTPQTVAMLGEPGDFVAGGMAGIGWGEVHGGLYGAWALTDRYFLAASGVASNFADEESDQSVRYAELAPGVRLSLPHNFFSESQAVIGLGRLEVFYPGYVGRIKAETHRQAVQQTLGWRFGEVEVGATLRAGYFQYRDIRGEFRTAYGQGTATDEEIKAYLENHDYSLLLEPGVTIRTSEGMELLPGTKGQFQAGLSRNITHPDFKQKDWWLSIGLLYSHRPWSKPDQ